MEKSKMTKATDCSCPKTACPNHGDCYPCITKHTAAESLPYCVFPNSDRTFENFYKFLKEKYEG